MWSLSGRLSGDMGVTLSSLNFLDKTLKFSQSSRSLTFFLSSNLDRTGDV